MKKKNETDQMTENDFFKSIGVIISSKAEKNY